MNRENLERVENTQEGWLPSKPGVRIWIAGALLLGLIVGMVIIWSVYQGNSYLSPKSDLDQPIGHEQLSSLYQEFHCPCCDQNIGECTCGSAEERRNIVRSMAIMGTSRRAIYEFMFLFDGPTAFFDQEMSALVRDWLTEKLPDTRPEISVEPLQIDMGIVSMAKGLVSDKFQVKNSGKSDLTINNMMTSCMCTTAVLDTSDGLSPTFGANQDENPENWSITLGPNEEAELIVTFDPNAHGPDAVGQIRRVITLSSNDPLQTDIKVEIIAEVVP